MRQPELSCPRLGERVSFTPVVLLPGDHYGRDTDSIPTVTGEITYINRKHGWYRVTATRNGCRFHECFHIAIKK